MKDVTLSPKPTGTLFDIDNQASAGVSLTGCGVRAIQVTGLAAGQTVTVQVRLNDSADWADYQVLDVSKPMAVVEFNLNYNRVRVTGLVAGHTVLAQG